MPLVCALGSTRLCRCSCDHQRLSDKLQDAMADNHRQRKLLRACRERPSRRAAEERDERARLVFRPTA
jgi:hypothetical protein